MKSKSVCFLSLFLGLMVAFASHLHAQQDPLELRDVRFDRVSNNWTKVTLTLDVRGNPSEDAPNRNFLDDIRVDCYVGYENRAPDADEPEYVFFRSAARIVTMERGRSEVHFFLPGPIVDRHRFRTDPFAWMIELEVGGDRLPLRREHVSDNLRSEEAVNNFRDRANSEGARNDGIFMPIYLVPPNIVSGARVNLNDLPVYFRLDNI